MKLCEQVSAHAHPIVSFLFPHALSPPFCLPSKREMEIKPICLWTLDAGWPVVCCHNKTGYNQWRRGSARPEQNTAQRRRCRRTSEAGPPRVEKRACVRVLLNVVIIIECLRSVCTLNSKQQSDCRKPAGKYRVVGWDGNKRITCPYAEMSTSRHAHKVK